MNSLLSLIEPLGWALLHFLWQGAAIALLLRGFLWLTRRSAPQIRYTAAGAALALMMAAVAGTLWWQVQRNGAAGTNGTQVTTTETAPSTLAAPQVPYPSNETHVAHASSEAQAPEATMPIAVPALTVPKPAATDLLRAAFPWLVGAWAAGVAVFSLRLVNGWRTVRRWRASGTETIPAEWQARFAALCERLLLTRSVQLLSSATVAVPVVIGWLKPAVLLPASLLAGLPAAQLEAVLSHELAHVRRYDYLVNLLQTLLETLFFYHPAVWWVSAQLRNEREHCCDDIAASLHGDTLGYARALTALEELRALPAVGVSAAGGSLLQRIRRLAGLPEERAASGAWPLGLLMLAVLAAILPFTMLREAGAQEGATSAAERAQALAKPRHEQTAALLKLWRKEFKDAPALPATAMQRLAAQVKEYIERYPGEPAQKMKAQLPAMEGDSPWTWDAAQELIDSLCDAATAPAGWLQLQEEFRSFDRVKPGQRWSAEQLAKLPFGDTDASGLRAAWIFDPMQDSYATGSVLKCRILFHNNGKEPVGFRTDQWHQEDRWIVKNAAGEEVKVKTVRYTGITPWQKVRLEPGEVFEVKAHGVGIGEGKYGESYSTGAIGAEIPAKPGDELTCQWVVQLDAAPRDPNWKPAPGTPPASLTTGTVKFKVTASDPDGLPKVGVARGTGKYDLADGVKLQVTQVTSSEDGKGTSRINTATIEWYAGNGQLGLSWPIELTPGLQIDPIVWKRGGSALWIVRNGVVRKIDYTNAADVKETVFKKGAISDYGGAPAEVALEILHIINTEIARLEEEIKVALPATKPGDSNQEQLVIDVKPDGSIVFKEKALTLDELAPQLTEIAKVNAKQAIIIRGSADTRYDKIVAVLDATHKAGLYHVSFATTKAEGTDEKKAAAERLLEQSAAAAARRDFDAARKLLRETAASLGKPGEDGFRDEYLLLLADAEVLLGRIDAKEADGIKDTETAGARQKAAELRGAAIKHYTDAVLRLLEFDRENPKSMPGRVRLAGVYLEMAGAFNLNGGERDAGVACREAIKIYVELLKEEPESVDHRLNLAKAYDLTAELARVMNPGKEGIRQALDLHQQGVSLLRLLLEKEPDNIQVARQLSTSLSWRIDLHRALGDTEAAEAVRKEAASVLSVFSDTERMRGAQETFESEFRPPGQAPVQELPPASAPEANPAAPSAPPPAKDAEKEKKYAGEKPKVIHHKNGTMTESVRSGDEIHERTLNAAGELIAKRVFYLDGRGRKRQAVIYDGNMSPLGTLLFGYDNERDELVEEQQYNKDGKLVRRLFYPGALKDPKYAGRFVAFTFDRDAGGEPSPADRFLSGGANRTGGKEETGPVSPTLTAEEMESSPADIERRLALTQGLYDLGQYEQALGEIEAVLRQDTLHEAGRLWRQKILAKMEWERDPFAVPADPAALAEARKVSIALTVLDSTGQKPVLEFRVIAGVRAGSAGGKDTINWQPHTLREGKDGGLLWPLDKAYDEMALRVEADGYAPQVFNWIEKKKGPQDLFFQMVEIKGLPAQVLMPDGKPAEGATVALAMVQRDAVLEGGKLRHADEAPAAKAGDQWRRPRMVKTNETGQCMLPAENDPTAALLVVHESGVREISLKDFLAGKDGSFVAGMLVHQIKLQPWARVSGKVQWADKPGAGQKVSLTIHRDSYGYPGIIAQYEKTTAAADGSFVFEKVLPGHVQLSCPIAAGAGNAAGITEINLTGRIAHTELKSGANTVVIGGGGTAIKGRLTGRDNWDGVMFHFHPTAPHIGFPGDDEMWKAWGEFQKSPEGALYFRSGLKVNADGTFEVGGVMPGDYQIFFKREGEDKYLASGKFTMKPETVQQEPMDIGEFKAGP
jgi:beta-lactamase regulating signal transducer with metallopeptidase domain/biopolymer transport protein ExbD